MTAPATRFVDQFSGSKAGPPSVFWQAMEDADDVVAELETLRGEHANRDELVEENWELRLANRALVLRISELRGQLEPVEPHLGKATGGTS